MLPSQNRGLYRKRRLLALPRAVVLWVLIAAPTTTIHSSPGENRSGAGEPVEMAGARADQAHGREVARRKWLLRGRD